MRLGQRLDVLDEINKWLEAFVIDESPTEVYPLPPVTHHISHSVLTLNPIPYRC